MATAPPTETQLRGWHEQAAALAREAGGPDWEETGERAVYLLELAYLDGYLPHYVRGWLRKVILSLLLKRKAGQGRLSFEAPGTMDRRGAVEPEPELPILRDAPWEALRPMLEPRLTRRQRAVFVHLPEAETMKDLARLAGVTPRDARNILWEIVVKARRLLGQWRRKA